jgi:hypothetical protein
MKASNPIDPSLALVRRVRRRRNAEALQRLAYGALATGTLAFAVLVLLALTASIEVLAAGIAVIAVAFGAATWMMISHTRRRWLGRARAVAWVDATAGLDHRLVTLVARHDRTSALVPLLVAESEAGLAPWTLDRLQPERVPWGHLTAAVVGAYLLVLVILTAPQWRPAELPLAPADGAIATAPDSRLANVAQRLRATTGAPRGAGTPGADASGASSGEPGAAKPARSTFPRLASALQRALRARLWGAEWARVAANTEAAPADATSTGTGQTQGVPTRSPARTRTASRDARPGDAGELVPGSGGTRAGAGTDPNLYGTRTGNDASAAGRFPIGLAALVRGPRGDPGPPSGDAPPSEPDAHPELAPVPRRPLPFPRTPVPPEWEAVVRTVFAHREGGMP